jgi:hypothetical protein
MKIFQFASAYHLYQKYIRSLYPAGHASYNQIKARYLNDLFCGVHKIEAPKGSDHSIEFTVANDIEMQNAWATEQGLEDASLQEILLAQIEESRSEVVYSLDPINFPSDFVRRLPGCVKRTICWQASPQKKCDYTAYGLRVCNFPHLLDRWKSQGQFARYLSPSTEPSAIQFAQETRDIDLLFIGQYSPNHRRRNSILAALAKLGKHYNVKYALLDSGPRPLVNLPGIRKFLRVRPPIPKELAAVAIPAVFGREMYALLGRSKVALNASIDMADAYRGNMRCYEILSTATCMIGEEGIYPKGLEQGRDLEVYRDSAEAIQKVTELINDLPRRNAMASSGYRTITSTFSKQAQWESFIQAIYNCPTHNSLAH